MTLNPEYLQTVVLGKCYHEYDESFVLTSNPPQYRCKKDGCYHTAFCHHIWQGKANPTFDNPTDYDLLQVRLIDLNIVDRFHNFISRKKDGSFYTSHWMERSWSDKCLYIQMFATENENLFKE